MNQSVPVTLDKDSLDEIIKGLQALHLSGQATSLTHTLIAGLIPMAGWKGVSA
jgi:hypothetical protein